MARNAERLEVGHECLAATVAHLDDVVSLPQVALARVAHRPLELPSEVGEVRDLGKQQRAALVWRERPEGGGQHLQLQPAHLAVNRTAGLRVRLAQVAPHSRWVSLEPPRTEARAVAGEVCGLLVPDAPSVVGAPRDDFSRRGFGRR